VKLRAFLLPLYNNVIPTQPLGLELTACLCNVDFVPMPMGRGKEGRDRMEGSGGEGICSTNVKLLLTALFSSY